MRRVRGLLVATALATALTRGAAAEEEAEEPRYSPWQSKKYTSLAASASDVGIVYARPHLTLGWGAPFWQFVGLDAYAIATNSFASSYAGWRASLPWLDVQWGARFVYPYNRQLLQKKESYGPADLPLGSDGERSTYRVVELEITRLAAVLHGVIFLELHPLWIDAPKDMHLFEEMMRAVVEPPFAMRTRLGYLYDFEGTGDKAGAMTEYMIMPGRPGNVTRVGPVLIVSLSQHYEILATATFTVSSPDSLGLYEGSYGFLGLRARWAQRLFAD